MENSPKLAKKNLHIEKQREFERRAAVMGGGNFVVPAQCVTDFISNRLSGTGVANISDVETSK